MGRIFGISDLPVTIFTTPLEQPPIISVYKVMPRVLPLPDVFVKRPLPKGSNRHTINLNKRIPSHSSSSVPKDDK